MIILTGGAGFIGSVMLAKLNEQGYSDILVVDELGSSEKWKNLVGKKFLDYVHKDKFIQDIQSRKISSVKAIFHFGACSSTTEKNIEYLIENNYQYTRTLAEWSVKNNARFIYASSAATYGNGELGFSDDDTITQKLHPLNAYGYSKHLFDMWALQSNISEKIVGIKFFNVFGPNEYHKGEMASLVYKAFFQIQQTGKMQLFKSYHADYKDGEQVRDFIYVKDCTEVLWWFFQNPKKNGIFNLGTGKSRSWNALANAIFSALEKKSNIEYKEMPETIRNSYQYHTQAEMQKLCNAGYTKEFLSLEDAVKNYVTKYLKDGVKYL